MNAKDEASYDPCTKRATFQQIFEIVPHIFTLVLPVRKVPLAGEELDHSPCQPLPIWRGEDGVATGTQNAVNGVQERLVVPYVLDEMGRNHDVAGCGLDGGKMLGVIADVAHSTWDPTQMWHTIGIELHANNSMRQSAEVHGAGCGAGAKLQNHVVRLHVTLECLEQGDPVMVALVPDGND